MATLEDGLEFPPELSWVPQALVGVAGLDTLNNAVHRIIWEALANSRRQDRPAVFFKLLGPVHEFPPMKPKVHFKNYSFIRQSRYFPFQNIYFVTDNRNLTPCMHNK